jgi:o-succinylbenzoate synthase
MRPFEWPLVRPLATAHGAIGSRQGLLVTLVDEQGRRGHGEATPLRDFGTESLATTRRALADALERVAGAALPNVDAAQDACADALAAAPCARAALATALLDLASQREGVSLARWLRARAGRAGAPLPRVAVQALVGGGTPESVAAAARSARDRGFEAFKLKLRVSAARRDLGLDLERVAALRETVGAGARIRLDANEAFTPAEAARALAAFARFAPDYVEQPVGRGRVEALAALEGEGGVAVAADEALLGAGFEACLEARAASVFVVKPAAWGGVAVALPRIVRAREAGIRVVLSNLIEGPVGRAAATALASAVAAPDEVHGLGTQDWLACDPAEAREVRAGAIAIGETPGLGVEPGSPPGAGRTAGTARTPARAGASWGEAWIASTG